MVLNLKKKKNIISKINQCMKSALSIVIADPTGIQANEMNDLRKKSRALKIDIKYLRNTLIKLSVLGTNFSNLKDKINGPNLIAFSYLHPGSGARLFKEFERKNNKCKIKIAIFEKKVLLDSDINYLVDLPTYEESIRSFITIIQEISIKKFIRMLIFIRHSKHIN
ncbi:50S ribosomal subunit protein L10 [Wigglesworthia glossinidia endosymbiont of Glossina morsitans morsitans (Yale colony)]|uniref:Large ribosomal subunit protein uL10 n=1 Tax=Wigglesworthia glossinidia endosymbiont of Glossina morsitans morsitans (Yale colony) TaxID=1142511 RepID=H6Q4L7_WIGGL|nr:50S ribosomal protein L10 [Wigglesworthia glossinidia]AFA41077.1 50S ribosomal subunit protein L10 [Wigglesworthia glossinidia endosymbiont of Glossina morsitans morsitans (Yale colony)]